MANYLIRQGNAYSVKVAIPADLQGHFEKKAFKQTLRTSDRTIAIARSGPLVAEFKRRIAEARGNPTGHLDDYLAETRRTLMSLRKDPDVDADTVFSIEDELVGRLLADKGAIDTEQLVPSAEAEVVKSFKVASGKATPFDEPLAHYIASRRVEPKTEAKDRHAVTKFAQHAATVEDVNRQVVRGFVAELAKGGLKNRTIGDNLSSLRTYWRWLVDQDIAPEDKANPFAEVPLPAVRRKETYEKVRLPFTVTDIQRLHEAISAGRSAMMEATFMLAIYTGCRLEELASLETSRVAEAEIEIANAKTAAGERVIPLHPALQPVVAWLMAEGTAKGSPYLLYDLVPNKYGHRGPAVSKQFGKVKTRLGFDGRYVFHSLRMTVATQFEQAGVGEGVAADILGHDKPTLSYGLYSGGSSYEQKIEAVMKLDYGLN